MKMDLAVNSWTAVADEPAPKDGRLVWLGWALEGDKEMQEVFVMRWGHVQRNSLFPGKVGMWVSSDGSFTWNDDNPDGAPTHWRPYHL